MTHGQERKAQPTTRHGRALKPADALVIATAQPIGADRILTTDRGWPRVDVAVEIVGEEA